MSDPTPGPAPLPSQWKESKAIHQHWLANSNPTIADAGAYEFALRTFQERHHACGPPEEDYVIQTSGQLWAWCRLRQKRFGMLDDDPNTPRPLIIAGAIRFAWKCLRELVGTESYPPEPPPPRNYAEAIRSLDLVVSWCATHKGHAPVPEPEGEFQSVGGLPGQPNGPADSPRDRFRMVGNMWDVRFRAEAGIFPALAGMNYLAKLLASPNRAISALALMDALPGIESAPHTRQPKMDAPGRKALDREILVLDQEIEQARKGGLGARVAELQEAREFVQKEARNVKSFYSKKRKLGPSSPAGQAADAVRKTLERAYNKMQPSMPLLVKHLRSSVRKNGMEFAYRPDSPAPQWDL